MNERRGANGHEDRDIFYCSSCRGSSAFEKTIINVENQPRVAWICVGQQRVPSPRPGCGKIMLDSHAIRFYGECMTCQKVRRAVKCHDGSYHCLYCERKLERVEGMAS